MIGFFNNLSIARKTAYLSAFCAVAIIFSYVETLIPINIVPIPSFKIGFANIPILIVLICFSLKSALMISIARTVVISLLFSNLTAVILSISGSVLALVFMWVALKAKVFSIYGISVLGATAHNIGQLIAASILIKSTAILGFLPYLMICSLITGIAIGLLVVYTLKILKVPLKN